MYYLEDVFQTLKRNGYNPCVCAGEQITEWSYAPSLYKVLDLLPSAT